MLCGFLRVGTCSHLDGRQITVEYAAKEDGQGRFTEDGDRGRDRDRDRDRDYRDEPRRRSPEYGRYRRYQPALGLTAAWGGNCFPRILLGPKGRASLCSG